MVLRLAISSHVIAPRTMQRAQGMAGRCCGGGRGPLSRQLKELAVSCPPPPICLFTVSCHLRQSRAFGGNQRQQQRRLAGLSAGELLPREMAVMWPEAEPNKDQVVRASVGRWNQIKTMGPHKAEEAAPPQEALWPASFRDSIFQALCGSSGKDTHWECWGSLWLVVTGYFCSRKYRKTWSKGMDTVRSPCVFSFLCESQRAEKTRWMAPLR